MIIIIRVIAPQIINTAYTHNECHVSLTEMSTVFVSQTREWMANGSYLFWM